MTAKPRRRRTTSKAPLKRVTMRVPTDIARGIEHLAEARGESSSEYIEQLIRRELETPSWTQLLQRTAELSGTTAVLVRHILAAVMQDEEAVKRLEKAAYDKARELIR